MRSSWRYVCASCLSLVLAASGCGEDGGDTPTSPSTTTIAEASTSEEFVEILPAGGSAFYSFSVTQYGTVNVTLAEIGGAYVPSSAWIGLGLGTPSGTDCATTSTVNVAPGTGPHLTGTYEVGVYCAKVWDIGNLYGPATVRVAIAHP